MCLMHVDADAKGRCQMLAVIGGVFVGDPARCGVAVFSGVKVSLVSLSHPSHRIPGPCRRL